MERYDEEMQVADELIRESGELATLRIFTTVDGTEEWDQGEPAEQTQVAPMVFLNFKSQSNTASSGERYFNGTLIQQNDKKVLLAGLATDVVPNINGTLVRKDGTEWKIVNVVTLDPNGQKVLHTMQVRR